MKRHPFAWILRFGFVIIWLSVPLLDGCSYYLDARRTTKKLAREVVTRDGDYRKAIAVTRFENRSFYTRDNISAFFQDKLLNILKSACPNALLSRPEDKDYPKFLTRLPQQANGRIDNLKLALAGRRSGFNAVVTGAVVDIGAYEERRGVFWLRETHSFIQVQIHVEVYDTETGAKILDENFIRDVEVDETDYDLIKQRKQISIAEIPETLEYIAKLLGEQICDALSGQHWKSYILSKDGKRIIIASGRKAGLRPGMKLAVYDSSKVVKGFGEERFFLPGIKTGEIKITYTHPDKSEAVIINDDGIQVGGAVRLK